MMGHRLYRAYGVARANSFDHSVMRVDDPDQFAFVTFVVEVKAS